MNFDKSLYQLFLVEDSPCPSCGSRAYVGFSNIECSNPECTHFSQKQYNIVNKKDDSKSKDFAALRDELLNTPSKSGDYGKISITVASNNKTIGQGSFSDFTGALRHNENVTLRISFAGHYFMRTDFHMGQQAGSSLYTYCDRIESILMPGVLGPVSDYAKIKKEFDTYDRLVLGSAPGRHIKLEDIDRAVATVLVMASQDLKEEWWS